ncbi:MAG: DNA adenine methylase, partial [bacterium]
AKAPLIKSQGIKTRLVPFILSRIAWDGAGRWVEPFVGSGAVLFNAVPERAIAADSNEHLIRLYQAVQRREVTPHSVEAHLKREGAALRQKGEDHYYEVRTRFNADHSPLDLIFLNRSCFNGVMRFNRRGGFNVPFCRKLDRFRPGLITKICNQVVWIAKQMKDKDWTFVTADWRSTLNDVAEGDFVYLDPPYTGRHTDYYNNWTDEEADALASRVKELPAGFAYSMWKENRYRSNLHLVKHFADYHIATFEHFYHVGSSEDLRNAMMEALVISPGYVADDPQPAPRADPLHLGL